MRLIRTHSDYAHIRFHIRICMYPNIFAYTDNRPHIYPIPKSAWEKIRMANSYDNVLIGVSKEGRGAGIATKQLVLPFYQIISFWDAELRWQENLSSFNCLRFSFGGTDWTGKAPTSNFSTDRVSIAHTLEQSQNHNPGLFSIILYIPLPIGISQSFYFNILWFCQSWVGECWLAVLQINNEVVCPIQANTMPE